nr:PREDICTED: ubiquitin-like protein 4A [Latimeria chalumnae]|eukprot:XP_014350625.1 PREDICTED: ubiquitin-like protein 4A [Latimeria chalumnae]
MSLSSVFPDVTDEHRLSDYSIGPDSKLNLVIKQPEKACPEETAKREPGQQKAIWQMLPEILAKHFTHTDAEKVLQQLQKNYDRKIKH